GVSFGAIILVRIVVLRGLRPLRDLGDQTREIDTENLSSRFTSKGTPEELVPIYDHLNDLIDRLEAGFDRERRFSSDLAHEMRTPVAELKMLHEVALKWPERAGEGTNRESLEIANQLETIIETLLALARCESGEVSVKEEPVNLADVVESSWDAYADRAKERSLNARFDFPEVPVVKKSDEALLRRVFDNLFSNAVDYAPEGDSIEVSVRNDGVTVSNEAPTFDPGDLPHLFDRHWRSDPARSESHHAGLGLSLARACAEALGLRLGAMWEGGRISFALQT
ncbi:MAG: ATP-binding protein, partial [Verrucomicrobiota bacterium]